MSANAHLDSVLIEWGERLFYPPNRIVKSHTPRLHPVPDRSAAIRSRIEATVRRAPQVMVKVTGGGRGMVAIAAHFRYITKNGRLDIEDDRGVIERGKDAVREIERQWQYSGARIEREGQRREAFNIMLSMPRGTDPLTVQRAAREFAKIEFADHHYVMVLHAHQAHPHVHLSVKAESKQGKRLNPRKADLQRWREVFAERLRERGIDAEATRQPTRGEFHSRDALWRVRARDEGRSPSRRPSAKAGINARHSREAALQAWKHIALALAQSGSLDDRKLARKIIDFVKDMPMMRGAVRPAREVAPVEPQVTRTRPGPEWER
jgi:Relaxase/Mobilisation nuclease domain